MSHPASNYRVNFGNGQVHYAGSKEKCEHFIKLWGDTFTYLEKLDTLTGDWLPS